MFDLPDPPAAVVDLPGASAMGAGPVIPAFPATAAPRDESAEITVMTYNVRGLPFPLATGRARAMEAIGAQLAELRKTGRQPTIVLIQEGFRREVADLVKASGYAYSAKGPSRKAQADAPIDGQPYRLKRYVLKGEGWGKLMNGGLYVLSDLPITEVRDTAYRYCAGWDCLANKGVMLARVKLADAPVELDVVNTHLNSKGASKVPRARSSEAHNLQVDELNRFLARTQGDRPLLIGGDFNVKHAPERYDYRPEARRYTVVSEYCARAEAACTALPPASRPAKPLLPNQVGMPPWLHLQELQGFINQGPVRIEPVASSRFFDSKVDGGLLSDHDGYVVRYRVAWTAPAAGDNGGR